MILQALLSLPPVTQFMLTVNVLIGAYTLLANPGAH